MSLHSDTLSWFRVNQSLLFLHNATNTNLMVFGLTWSGLEPTIYCTRGEHVNHYTKDAGFYNFFFALFLFFIFPLFSRVLVVQSLDFCLVFYRSLFVLLYFSFGHCVVCLSSIYVFGIFNFSRIGDRRNFRIHDMFSKQTPLLPKLS